MLNIYEDKADLVGCCAELKPPIMPAIQSSAIGDRCPDTLAAPSGGYRPCAA
jgi:hypothetical protein